MLVLILTIFTAVPQAATESGANTNRNTAFEISPNETVTGKLETPAQDKWYKFALAAPGKVSLQYNLSGADPAMDMVLYKDTDKIRTWDLRSAYASMPLKTNDIRLPEGTYYIFIDGYGNASNNEYNITINYTQEGTSANEIEYNNSRNTATPLQPNGTIIGNLSFSDDDDWYRIELPTNGKVSINYNLTGEDPAMDMVLYKDTTKIRTWDLRASQASMPCKTNNIRLPAGTYYLFMDGYSNGSNKDYTITFNFEDESGRPFEAEYNNDRNSANLIQLGQEITGNLSFSDDDDWYRFEFSGGSLDIYYNLSSGDPAMDMVLYNGTTKVKTYDLRSSQSSMPYSVTTDPLTAGTYYIFMDGYSNGSNNDYTLRVGSGTAATPTPVPTATPTLAPTATPIPTATPTPTVIPTAAPTYTPATTTTPAPTTPPSTGDPVRGFNTISITVGVRLSWTHLSGGVGYRVYRSEDSNSDGISVTDFYITSTEFVDVNVEANTNYYYTIRQVIKEARPFAGEPEVLGPYSNKINVTTPSTITGGTGSDKHFILMKINDPYMAIDGIKQEIDPGRGTTPMIQNNRTLVPIRAIVEGMGGSVSWDEDAQRIGLNYKNNSVEMWLESKSIRVNGGLQSIDVPPTSINYRTMVPIRFAAENLGCVVDWLNSSEEVVIVYQ